MDFSTNFKPNSNPTKLIELVNDTDPNPITTFNGSTLTGRTVDEIQQIVNHKRADASVLSAVVQLGAVVQIIVHTTVWQTLLGDDAYVALDPIALGSLQLAPADLVRIAGRTHDVDVLSSVTGHVNHSPDSDTTVLNNPATRMDDLATIVGRTTSVTDLALVMERPDYDSATLDSLILQNDQITAVLLSTLACITTQGNTLAAIIAHPKTDGSVLGAVTLSNRNLTNPRPDTYQRIDSSVLRNIQTTAADLVIIAGRTTWSADLKLIATHPNADAAALHAVVARYPFLNVDTAFGEVPLVGLAGIDTAVLGNSQTASADLATIAARTRLPSDLMLIAAHPNAEGFVVTAVLQNAENRVAPPMPSHDLINQVLLNSHTEGTEGSD